MLPSQGRQINVEHCDNSHMSEITQWINQKTVDDGMKLLEKSREQPIVKFTTDRTLARLSKC